MDSLRTAGVYPTKVNLSIIALTPLKRHGSAQSFTVPVYANQRISRRSHLISDGASPHPAKRKRRQASLMYEGRDRKLLGVYPLRRVRTEALCRANHKVLLWLG